MLPLVDPVSATLLSREVERQRSVLQLIPSENLTSRAVREALGSVFTNVYSEGRPKNRYYSGQHVVDAVELLAEERARSLFGAAHANVQPYSGSVANASIMLGLLSPGDTVLSMQLDHGGHLSHGFPRALAGRIYRVVSYGVDPNTDLLDMDTVRTIAVREQPKLIVAGTSSYPREVDWSAFRRIADEVGALLLADISHTAGLIAGGVLTNPVPFADAAMTTTHKTLRGPRGAIAFCAEAHAKAIDTAVFPGLQGGPHDNTSLAIAVALAEASTPEFRSYAAQVVSNAKALAEALLARGHRLVSGGTDTHLLLVDLRPIGIGGRAAQDLLESAGMCTNRNVIPGDPRPALDPSGLRLGTPALTTRGLKEPDMDRIAAWIDGLLRSPHDADLLARTHDEVRDFAQLAPLP